MAAGIDIVMDDCIMRRHAISAGAEPAAEALLGDLFRRPSSR